MLTKRQLATIRAALLFWKEEIAIHDSEIAAPYLEDDSIEPLDPAEVEALRSRFEKVCYVTYDPQNGTLADRRFLVDAGELDRGSLKHTIATVILPG